MLLIAIVEYQFVLYFCKSKSFMYEKEDNAWTGKGQLRWVSSYKENSAGGHTWRYPQFEQYRFCLSDCWCFSYWKDLPVRHYGNSSSPEIHKTALGAEDSVEWEHVDNIIPLIEKLKSDGYKVCAIEQVNGSVNMLDFTVNKNGKYAVILGNEVKGVKQEAVDASDVCIELPQYGTKHSLNVSITAGIVMWNFFISMKK